MLKKSLSVLLLIIAVAFSGIATLGCGVTRDIVCKNVTVNNGAYVLDGEITLPKEGENFPAVIIVPGSGGLDMDGTVGAQKPYRDMAYKLAENGVACIRYNKVTYQYAEELVSETDFTVADEYFYAIRSCIDILKQTESIDDGRIFLLGHSLGSQMISVVLKDDASLAGGIIMAGTTAHLLDLIMEQTKMQDEALYNEYLPYYRKAVSLESVPVGEENYYYFGAYGEYWVSYNRLDRSAVEHVSCPLLIMQGGLDLQVSEEHFNSYKTMLKNKTNVQFKSYAELNHLFSNGKGETVQTAYRRSGEIPAEVIDDIVRFVS